MKRSKLHIRCLLNDRVQELEDVQPDSEMIATDETRSCPVPVTPSQLSKVNESENAMLRGVHSLSFAV